MSDVRRLLTEARGDLPPTGLDIDEITRRGRRTVRRRRWAAVGATAAVALAVASAVPLVRDVTRPAPAATGPATVSPAPALTFTFGGYAVGDYRVADPVQVTPGYEVAPVWRDHAAVVDAPGGTSLVVGSVTVYRAGAFDPAEFRAGTAVVVNGRPGWQRTFAGSAKAGAATVSKPALAWEYAADAWVVVRSAGAGTFGLAAGQVRTLADRFAENRRAVATLPYRMGYVPAGYRLVAAGSSDLADVPDTALGRVSQAYLVRGGMSFQRLSDPIELGYDGVRAGLSIAVSRKEIGGAHPRPVVTTCKQSGAGAYCDLSVPHSDYYVEVADLSKRLSVAEVKAVTDGLTFADPAEPGGWYPAVG